jgi:pimeloyl-ACP methyl ester carboxylesterase
MPYVINDRIRIYYEMIGDGPPLVLQHGFSDSLGGWFEYGYVASLRENYQLILIDSRGHGQSDKPVDADSYTLETRVADVISVLDVLNVNQAHFFGYSLGGWIGFGLAKHAPERLRSIILGGVQPYGQSFAAFRQVLQNGLDAWADIVVQMADPVKPDRTRFLANNIEALSASVVYDRPDISDLLPFIKVPCLLFAGDADPIHAQVQRCSQELPAARFSSLPGLNHFQAVMRGDLVLPHITHFLASLPDQEIG